MTDVAALPEALIFDQFEEAVALFDREARYRYLNGAMCAQLALSQPEALGRCPWELDSSLRDGPFARALKRAISSGAAQRIEHSHPRTGSCYESRFSVTPAGVYVFTTQVTGRTQATRDDEYERLTSLFQQSPAAIAVLSAPDWVFEYSNARNDEITGKGPLVGRNVFEAIPELVSQGFAHLLDLIYRTGETFDDVEVQLQVNTEHGPREVYLNGSYQPIRDASGRIDRVAAFVHDVTEKVRARQRIEALADELAISESRARRLQDSGVIGVVFWTRAGLVEGANDAFLSMVGYTREELTSGRVSWADMTPPEFAQLDARAFAEMEETGICKPYEKVFIGKNGRRVPILIGLAFWEGSIDSGVAWIVDISHRMSVEAERDSLLERERLARAQAEQANRSKDEFLAMVSHELRTPLNAMLGWARMLSSGILDQAKQKRGLEVIERNAVAQAQLIEDLLDVSRIVHGKLRLDVASVDPHTEFEAAVDALRPTFEAKGIQLVVALERVEPILGDTQRLQQIALNLLSNAAKFTPKGGRVEVRLRQVESCIQLTVADSGRGIAPSALPFVFDRFRQGDASITRSFGGLGLGLSIARHLAELHGGTIEAESAGEGKGSRFTLTIGSVLVDARLPRDLHAVLPQRTAAGEGATPLSGVRVLVVDDEADARELTSTILSHRGAAVVTAASAAHALRLLQNAPLDVMLSDIGMPEEDGYDLIRRVRRLNSPIANIPAAALTAFTRPEERREMMSAGFQLHVAKPVEPMALTVAVAYLARIGNASG